MSCVAMDVIPRCEGGGWMVTQRAWQMGPHQGDVLERISQHSDCHWKDRRQSLMMFIEVR
jgi:hypothetical protein